MKNPNALLVTGDQVPLSPEVDTPSVDVVKVGGGVIDRVPWVAGQDGGQSQAAETPVTVIDHVPGTDPSSSAPEQPAVRQGSSQAGLAAVRHRVGGPS